jgi:hypothetical protein
MLQFLYSIKNKIHSFDPLPSYKTKRRQQLKPMKYDPDLGQVQYVAELNQLIRCKTLHY